MRTTVARSKAINSLVTITTDRNLTSSERVSAAETLNRLLMQRSTDYREAQYLKIANRTATTN